MQEHIIQITFAYPAGEITIVNITHLVIRQTFIFQSTGNFIICPQIILLYVRIEIIRLISIRTYRRIICPQIILLYVRIEISRIILIPSPVTGHIE